MSKDFELIARVLRNAHAQERESLNRDVAHQAIDDLAADFANELNATNPRFARERFIAACMGEDSHDSAGRTVRYSALTGQLSAWQEHQEGVICRARQIAPNDDRLIEASGDDEIRDASFAVACELLGESA